MTGDICVRCAQCTVTPKVLAARWEERGSYQIFVDVCLGSVTACVTWSVVPNTVTYRHHRSRGSGKERGTLLPISPMSLCWLHQQKLIILRSSLKKKKGLIFISFFNDNVLHVWFCNTFKITVLQDLVPCNLEDYFSSPLPHLTSPFYLYFM